MVVHPDSEFLDDIAGILREVCCTVGFLQGLHSNAFNLLSTYYSIIYSLFCLYSPCKNI